MMNADEIVRLALRLSARLSVSAAASRLAIVVTDEEYRALVDHMDHYSISEPLAVSEPNNLRIMNIRIIRENLLHEQNDTIRKTEGKEG